MKPFDPECTTFSKNKQQQKKQSTQRDIIVHFWEQLWKSDQLRFFERKTLLQ